MTVELQQKTGGSGPDQIMYAYHTGNPGMRIGSEIHVYTDPITGETIVEIIEITGPIAVPLPAFPPGIAPPDFGQTQPNIEHQQRDLDAYGRVIAERTSTGASQITQDDYDLGKECCGKTAASCEGTLMADAKRSRGYVKEQIDMNKDLLTDGSGAMNKVGPPWDVLIPPDGPPVGKITIAYLPEELLPPFPWAQYNGDDTTDEGTVETYTDPITGRLSLIVQKQDGQENFAVPLKYDAFGRLTGCTDTTQTPSVDKQLTNDWLTGNIIVEEDTGNGDTWAHSHSHGQSRITIAYLPEEFMPRWLIRGPHGQVRLDVDANGHVTDFYGYSSWGNRINHENYESPYKPPAYLDGDYAPVPGFEQFKVGAGTAQDMTQMFGALDVAKESGAAGDGASGNPDVGPGCNSTFLQDGNRSGFYAGGEWHDTELKLLPAYPSELHLPGTGTDKAPPSAPQTAEDMATQADKRLRDTWGAQRFWGPKPGQQTGSRQLDDYRDMFQPLPAYPPIGGISGPAGFGSWRWVPPGPIPPPPVPLPASPPAGPWPVLPNEDSGADGDSGGSGGGESGGGGDSGGKGGGGNGNTGGADYDAYHKAMEGAAGGAITSLPGVNYLAEKSAAVTRWAQDRVDDTGERVCGEQNWSNFRDVVNFENKYISAIDNAADFAAIGAYGAGLVKGGLKGIAKAGLKRAGKKSVVQANYAFSKSAEARFAKTLSPNAELQKYYHVEGLGGRFLEGVDHRIGYELKTGRAFAAAENKLQAAKDAALVRSGKLKEVSWKFEVGRTGNSGLSAGLRGYLKSRGIRIIEDY